MTNYGRYGDSTLSYLLPDGWASVEEEVLDTALAQTLAALTGVDVVGRVAAYYDPAGAYAGTLFLDVEPNSEHTVEAADLYALTTLSMPLHVRQGRLLLQPGETRQRVQRQLRGLHPSLPITDLDHGEGGSAETLQRMYELHAGLRTLVSEDSNRWVFAAKLCARKRPLLFPVRDNLVCSYLGGGRRMKTGDGWPGDFSVDIQVYAYLMTSPEVTSALSWLRAELTDGRGLRLDENLRLLDSALWMAAN